MCKASELCRFDVSSYFRFLEYFSLFCCWRGFADCDNTSLRNILAKINLILMHIWMVILKLKSLYSSSCRLVVIFKLKFINLHTSVKSWCMDWIFVEILKVTSRCSINVVKITIRKGAFQKDPLYTGLSPIRQNTPMMGLVP